MTTGSRTVRFGASTVMLVLMGLGIASAAAADPVPQNGDIDFYAGADQTPRGVYRADPDLGSSQTIESRWSRRDGYIQDMSPDGTQILYRVYPGESIRSYDTLTGADRQILPSSYRIRSAAWSPDGQYVLAYSFDDRKLWVVDIPAQTATLADTGNSNFLDLTFSPKRNGDKWRIAYLGVLDGPGWGVVVADIDLGTATVTNETYVREIPISSGLAWTADGDWILTYDNIVNTAKDSTTGENPLWWDCSWPPTNSDLVALWGWPAITPPLGFNYRNLTTTLREAPMTAGITRGLDGFFSVAGSPEGDKITFSRSEWRGCVDGKRQGPEGLNVWTADIDINEPGGDFLSNLQMHTDFAPSGAGSGLFHGTEPYWQAAPGTDACTNGPDLDSDGLSDCVERSRRTDPNDEDTDDDGVWDGQEMQDGTDPRDPDSDDDGASDGEEKAAGTDPNDEDDYPEPDSDGDGVPDIVETFVPLMYLDNEESNPPMSADEFIAESQLYWLNTEEDCGIERDLVASTIDAGRLGTSSGNPYTHGESIDKPGLCTVTGSLYASSDLTRPWQSNPPGRDARLVRDGDGFYLDLLLDESERNARVFNEGSPPPVYYEYERGNFITYWLFYPYSVPGGGSAGVVGLAHEGDWEHVTVNLNADGSPHSVTYYYHHDKLTVPWVDVPKDGGRPEVFVAEESHASYWTTDCFDITVTAPWYQKLPVFGVAFDKSFDNCSDTGDVWDPLEVLMDARDQEWYGFGGAWGFAANGGPKVSDRTAPMGPHPLRDTDVWVTEDELWDGIVEALGPWMMSTGDTESVYFTTTDDVGTVLGGESHPGSDVDVALIAPDGTRITCSNAPSKGAVCVEGATYEWIVAPNAMAGEWKLELIGIDLAPGGEPVTGLLGVLPTLAGAQNMNVDDWDADGVQNPSDNCRYFANASQTDGDVDGIGDPCDPVHFADMDGHWAVAPVEAVYANDITQGCDTAPLIFCPNSLLTRAELTAFVLRATGEDGSLPSYQGTFPDVAAGKWYTGYVEKAAQLGYVTGYGDGTFGPNQQMTRAEMAVVMIRALGESDPPVPISDPFTDVAKDSWYGKFVNRLKALGITNGYTDGTYRPQNQITRAEVAAMIERAWTLTTP